MPPACNDDDDAAACLPERESSKERRKGILPRLTIRLWDESLPGKKGNIKHKDG